MCDTRTETTTSVKFAPEGKYHCTGSKWDGGTHTDLKNVEYQNTLKNARIRKYFIHYAQNGATCSISMAIEFNNNASYQEFSNLCPSELKNLSMLVVNYCIIKFHSPTSDHNRYAVKKMLLDILDAMHKVDAFDEKTYNIDRSFYNLDDTALSLKDIKLGVLLPGVDVSNPDNSDIELRTPPSPSYRR